MSDIPTRSLVTIPVVASPIFKAFSTLYTTFIYLPKHAYTVQVQLVDVLDEF